MNAPGLAGLDLFTDVCHLTDEGNRWMARQLDARLAWRHAAVMADAR